MTLPPEFTRRGLLAATGAAGLLAASGLRPAAAQTAPRWAIGPDARRIRVGAFELLTLLDGATVRDNPATIFGTDQPPEAVAALLAQNFLPPDRALFVFTPTVVRAGAETVLFDTGLGAGARGGGMGRTAGLLAANGIAPDSVTTVVLTHFHGDHIGGMAEGGAPAFPNARIVTSRIEYDFWTHPDRLSGRTENTARAVQANVVPQAERISFIEPGQTVVPGIEAVAAHGHTPGHLAFHLESEGQRFMITADACNHYVLSLQRPDWHVLFDMDKEAAARTRKSLFGMLAADRVPFIGYHFPSIGFVEPLGEGFRFVPATYQFDV